MTTVYVQQPGMAYGAPQQVQMVAYVAPVYKQWKVPVCSTCTTDASTWCFTCCCPQCAIYQQRKRLLAFTGEPYSCFQTESFPRPETCCSKPYTPPPRILPTNWPPAPSDMMTGEAHLGQTYGDFHFRVCLEVCCLPMPAMMVNRRLIKYKFNVYDTCCEKFLTCGLLFGAGGGGSVNVSVGGVDGQLQGDGCGAAIMACLSTQQHLQLQEEEALRMGKPLVVVQMVATNGQVAPMQQHMQ